MGILDTPLLYNFIITFVTEKVLLAPRSFVIE